jgi:cyanophycin synthetase
MGRRIVLAGPLPARRGPAAIADAVAGKFDLIAVGTTACDRAPDEVPKISRRALQARGRAGGGDLDYSRRTEAIDAALRMGQTGDLLVFAGRLDLFVKQITSSTGGPVAAAAAELARPVAR